MNSDAMIDKLINLAMSERQAKVYLALLQNGSATAAELQKASGVLQSKIYEIVRFLVSDGYCRERKAGRNHTYEAIDPLHGFASIISKQEQRLDEYRNLQKELSDIYKSSDKRVEPFEYIEILHGHENVHNRHIELLRNAKKEFIHFVKPPFAYMTEKMRLEQIEAYEIFHKNCGNARWIYEINENSNEYTIESMGMVADEKDHFRVHNNLPIKMSIFDRETLLLSEKSNSVKDELSMSVIKQKTMVNGYLVLFEYFWEKSSTYDEWIAQRKEKSKPK